MGGPHVGWGSEKADLMRISNICQAFRSFSAFQYLAFSITPLIHHSLGDRQSDRPFRSVKQWAGSDGEHRNKRDNHEGDVSLHYRRVRQPVAVRKPAREFAAACD